MIWMAKESTTIQLVWNPKLNVVSRFTKSFWMVWGYYLNVRKLEDLPEKCNYVRRGKVSWWCTYFPPSRVDLTATKLAGECLVRICNWWKGAGKISRLLKKRKGKNMYQNILFDLDGTLTIWVGNNNSATCFREFGIQRCKIKKNWRVFIRSTTEVFFWTLLLGFFQKEI